MRLQARLANFNRRILLLDVLFPRRFLPDEAAILLLLVFVLAVQNVLGDASLVLERFVAVVADQNAAVHFVYLQVLGKVRRVREALAALLALVRLVTDVTIRVGAVLVLDGAGKERT